MIKFNINDKVKLKHPINIDDYIEYIDEWQEFWSDNKNTIFTIHSVTNTDIGYHLQYTNGDDVMNPNGDDIAIFYDRELEPCINNSFPDELFEME